MIACGMCGMTEDQAESDGVALRLCSINLGSIKGELRLCPTCAGDTVVPLLVAAGVQGWRARGWQTMADAIEAGDHVD